jgi:small subunit ribosomal protein S7
MSRKIFVKKKFVEKDLKYNHFLVTLLINKILKKGKKNIARKIVYDAFNFIKLNFNLNPIYVFEKAIRNISPKIILKKKIISGSIMKIPFLLNKYHSINLSLKWIVENSKKRLEKNMYLKLANEIIDSSKNFGLSLKKKEEIYKLAEFNKVFK